LKTVIYMSSGFSTIRIKITQDTQAVADTIIQQSRIDVTNGRKWSWKIVARYHIYPDWIVSLLRDKNFIT
jgi:hypothetical protein